MKIKYIVIGVFSVGALLYGGYLIKKSFIDKGYESKEDAKEVLLTYYVISLGLPDTKENRDKYRYKTLEELKRELNLEDIEVK